MHDDFTLGRIKGIRIGANWSLLVVVLLIAWSLADGIFPEAAPGYSDGTYWAVGIGAALVFFACLLAHELSHSLVARRRGVQVKAIVLWLFGGVSELESEAHDAESELRIAAAGPLASLAVGGGFLALAVIADALFDVRLLTAALAWIGLINWLLAVFNLLPAFPLDGGRVLRAWLWRRRGDKVDATQAAARVGRVVAYGLMGAGLVEALAGGLIGGLWLVFLAWFLLSAARVEATESIVNEQLAHVPVREVMTPNPITVPPHTTVQQLLDRWLLRYRCSTFPIVADGDVVGLVTLARVKRVPPAERSTTWIVDIACPRDEVVTCAPDDPVSEVLAAMNRSADQRALVFEHGQLVGVVSPSDIARRVERSVMAQAPAA
jgi:Zn-dependent protease/predicted transcriptional regulator